MAAISSMVVKATRVFFDVNQADVTFGVDGDGNLLVTGSTGETDTLSNVEILIFADGTVNVADIEVQSVDIDLALGVTETGSFGNGFNGTSDADGIITAGFESTGSDLTLTFDGHDVDFDDEIEAFLNDTSLGFLGAGVNNGEVEYSFDIAAADQQAGDNVITFEQAINDTFVWGVTDILIA